MCIGPVSRFVLLVIWTVFPLACLAQGTDAAAIAGLVLAPDGTPIEGARVMLSAPDASTRIVTSAGNGDFLFHNLPSGSYSIETIAGSFAIDEETISVAVDRTTHISIHLSLAGAQQNVRVTAAPVPFDSSQTSSVVNIDRDRVEELPIPSRNYLDFLRLSPQVAAANPALQQGLATDGGGFSFGGLRPGSNAIYLDGVNDIDEYTGSSRTQLSPEAISDFQIVNHGFAAQSGGGAGGSIDVETRSGVNRIHGDAFTFVQNGALNGTPPLGLNPYKPDESRIRSGIALGGPIQRDRTFYYVAAEQEMARGEDSAELDAPTLALFNKSIQEYAPLSGLTLRAGFFPTTDDETELSGRIDRTLTRRESIMLRYALTNTRNVNDAYHTDELTDRSARGSLFLSDNSLNGTLASTRTGDLLNRFSFEVAQRRAVERTGQTTGPGILVAGTALFGTPYSGNDRRFETHTEFADTVALQHGQHLMQVGARADHVALRTRVPDGSQGLFVFGDLGALRDRNPDFFAHSFGDFDTSLSEVRFAGFAQDHWEPFSSLALDCGLRYEYNRLPSSFPQDALNFSPRVGIAWTPNRSMIIRSGFGIFYDRFLLATINRISEFDGIHASLQILEDSDAASLYQSGRIPSNPLSGVAPSIWTTQSALRNPYSQVASLGMENLLPWRMTLTGEYQFVRGVHLGRSENVNLAPPVLLTEANAPALGISSPAPQQLGRLTFTRARLDPGHDALNQFSASADSSHNGATITVNRQFQDDVELMAGYTYSKTVDDASSDSEQPQNPYTTGGERARSLMDGRHRFTLSGLWLIGPDLADPADAAKAANPSPLMKALTAWSLLRLSASPVASLQIHSPASIATGNISFHSLRAPSTMAGIRFTLRQTSASIFGY